MNFSESLHARLSNYAALTALVPAAQIEIGEREEGKPYPGILYRFRERPEKAMGGTVAYVVELEVEIWSDNYDTALDIADQVTAALDEFDGLLGGAGGVTVIGSFLRDQSTDSGRIFPDDLAFLVTQLYEITYLA